MLAFIGDYSHKPFFTSEICLAFQLKQEDFFVEKRQREVACLVEPEKNDDVLIIYNYLHICHVGVLDVVKL